MVHFQADTTLCSFNGSVGNRMVSFKVLGQPVPQLRMKFVRGKYIDPSGRLKGEFCDRTSDVLNHMGIRFRPYFPRNIQVGVRIVYVITRPNYHFEGNDRSSGVLKQIHSSRHIAHYNRQGDVDNYTKFTLDAISNRMILTDDSQVIHFEAIKMFEEVNEGGLTSIDVYKWNEDETIQYAPTMG